MEALSGAAPEVKWSLFIMKHSDESDHLEQNLVRVFERPKDFLEGPDALRGAAEEHFVIVGAGIAGLTSALLLLEAGHRWCLGGAPGQGHRAGEQRQDRGPRPHPLRGGLVR